MGSHHAACATPVRLLLLELQRLVAGTGHCNQPCCQAYECCTLLEGNQAAADLCGPPELLLLELHRLLAYRIEKGAVMADQQQRLALAATGEVLLQAWATACLGEFLLHQHSSQSPPVVFSAQG